MGFLKKVKKAAKNVGKGIKKAASVANKVGLGPLGAVGMAASLLGGNKSGGNGVDKADTSTTQALIDQANKNVKSAAQLNAEGVDVSGQQANNAAANAASNAANAMANQGGGKIAKALAASNAATTTSANTFNDTLQNNTNLAQQQNKTVTDNLMKKAGVEETAENNYISSNNAANRQDIQNDQSMKKALIGGAAQAGLAAFTGGASLCDAAVKQFFKRGK